MAGQHLQTIWLCNSEKTVAISARAPALHSWFTFLLAPHTLVDDDSKCQLVPIPIQSSLTIRRRTFKCISVESCCKWSRIVEKASCAWGLMQIEVLRDADYLFARRGAQWKSERELLKDNWASGDDGFYPGKDSELRRGAHILAVANDGGDILRETHCYELLAALNFVLKNVTAIHREVDGDLIRMRRIFYSNVCIPWRRGCFDNDQASIISKMVIDGHGTSELTYPYFRSEMIAGVAYLAASLGGVTLNQVPVPDTVKCLALYRLWDCPQTTGTVLTAKAWLLTFPLKSDTDEEKQLSTEWELALGEVFEKFVPKIARHLKFAYFHSLSTEMELEKNSAAVMPKFITCYLLLVGFATTCAFSMTTLKSDMTSSDTDQASDVSTRSEQRQKSGKWLLGNMSIPCIDYTTSKPLVAICAVMAAVLAVLTTNGALVLCGTSYPDIVNVMPFLALWSGTAPRMAHTLEHAAVSVTITTLTDSLSFAVGIFAPLPAVSYFCVYSAMAIIVTYFYTLSFLAAVLVYQGRLEVANRHCILMIRTKSTASEDSPNFINFVFNMGTHRPSEPSQTLKLKQMNKVFMNGSESTSNIIALPKHKSESPETTKYPMRNGGIYSVFLARYYAPVLCNGWVKTGTFLLFCAYCGVAIHGAMRLKIGFEFRKVFISGSNADTFYKYREEYFGQSGRSRVDVIVQKPPTLWINSERSDFRAMVTQFESTPYSIGSNTTELWLNAFENYIDNLGFSVKYDFPLKNAQEFYTNLKAFLLTDDFYAYDIKWTPTMSAISNFRFAIQLKPIENNDEKVEAARYLRELAKSYYDRWGVVVSSSMFALADQFEIILPLTLQNVAIAVVCMIVISLVLIPRAICSLAIAFTIVSIDLGVVGYMTLWNINLDCISMITIAMSIGFSVDFAAHVTYAFVSCPTIDGSEPTANDRIAYSLGNVGTPLTQAALSTLLGVTTLITVDTYIVQTCVKTVILVVIFGLLHALLFLPVILISAHQLSGWVSNKLKQDTDRCSSNNEQIS